MTKTLKLLSFCLFSFWNIAAFSQGLTIDGIPVDGIQKPELGFLPSDFSLITADPEDDLYMNGDQYFDYLNRLPKQLATAYVISNSRDTSYMLFCWRTADYQPVLSLHYYLRDRPMDLEDEAFSAWQHLDISEAQFQVWLQFYQDAKQNFPGKKGGFVSRGDCFNSKALHLKAPQDSQFYVIETFGERGKLFENFHWRIISNLIRGSDPTSFEKELHRYLPEFYALGNVNTEPHQPQQIKMAKLHSAYEHLQGWVDKSDYLIKVEERGFIESLRKRVNYLAISPSGRLIALSGIENGKAYDFRDVKVLGSWSQDFKSKIGSLDSILLENQLQFHQDSLHLKGIWQALRNNGIDPKADSCRFLQIQLIKGTQIQNYYLNTCCLQISDQAFRTKEQETYLETWRLLDSFFPKSF